MGFNFSEYYKTLSNTELLEILENPGDYLPEAIEAAKTELSARNLNEEDLSIAKAPLDKIKIEKAEMAAKVNTVKEGIKDAAVSVTDLLNPVPVDLKDPKKHIVFITLAFALLILTHYLRNFKTDLYTLQIDGLSSITGIFTLIPLVVWPLGVILFGLRKKAGWILLCIVLAHFAVATLWLFMSDFNRSPGNDNIFTHFNQPDPLMNYILQLGFVALALYAICRKSIRDVFGVSGRTAGNCIILPSVITFIIMIPAS